ncbi:MAG: FapA family protein [Planctomycetota bacterium]
MATEPARMGVLLDRARELVGTIESTWDGAEVFTVQDHLRLAHKLAEDPARRVALQKALADLDRFVRSQNNPVGDPGAQVVIENTSLYAYLSLLPPRPGQPVVAKSRMERAIASAGVRVGADRSAIDGAYSKFSQRREVVHHLKIAAGTLPRRGEDGSLQRCAPILEPDLLLSGRAPADLLGLLRGVKEKTLLVRVLPPGAGVPGVTVMGKEIPAPGGRAYAVVPGEGTAIRERDEIVSLRAGVPTLRAGRLCIEPWEVQAGGSRIDSPKGVLLAGDHVGERIRARDLCVDGNLEAARVEVSGDVFVRGEVRNGARVRAGGSVWTRGVVSAELEAGGDVKIAGPSTSSIVAAGGKVEAVSVVGGTLIALLHVQVGRLGSNWGERTRVSVGRGKWIEQRREGRADALSEARRSLDTVVRTREERSGGREPKELPAADQDVVLTSLAEEARLRREISRLEAEETNARRGGKGQEPSVRILEGVSPPVVLEIEGQQVTIKEPKGPLVVMSENLSSLGRETRTKR